MSSLKINAYEAFLPQAFIDRLSQDYEQSPIANLKVAKGLLSEFPDLLHRDALQFMVDLFEASAKSLHLILEQRSKDRAFLDQLTLTLNQKNAGVDYLSPNYQTIIDCCDENQRKLVGFLDPPKNLSQVTIPDEFKGEQITLFGPPDSAKMTINAMNALYRKIPNEPKIVEELVEKSGEIPRWGADSEDSKTPLMRNLLLANQNLKASFKKELVVEENQKRYELAPQKLAKAIKRIPGIALADGNHLYQGSPLPLHLVDFAIHFFHNHLIPEALVFYIPKLENEEEALYLRNMLQHAEQLIQKISPQYQVGSIRLMIVFENPRAIFRIQEIAQALYPYFMGGSLGWHDFLASTARLFKNDPNYRIPVKADPNIVIHHIKESHVLLAQKLGEINAIKLGGMYGILYEDGNQASFEISMIGYIKDVITQLKRGLDGFWVAHPAFVRIGIALTYAFRCSQKGDQAVIVELIHQLVRDEMEREKLIAFVFADDISGLDSNDPLYFRGILAANLHESQIIKNHDEKEVRYNIFQALQYIADWLSGNGCVALPAVMKNQKGEDVFVRVMDDLATTERSRWELWAEVHHGRVSPERFEFLLADEVRQIRNHQENQLRKIQVKWTQENHKWYEIAVQILRILVLSDQPVEFATELLLPFSFDLVRQQDRPLDFVKKDCPQFQMI